MDLRTRTDRDLLPETPGAPIAPGRRTALVQAARLSIGVGGIAGGAFLFATNIAAALTTAGSSIPWVPLSANLALVFGSVMFLREFRRARQSSHGHAS